MMSCCLRKRWRILTRWRSRPAGTAKGNSCTILPSRGRCGNEGRPPLKGSGPGHADPAPSPRHITKSSEGRAGIQADANGTIHGWAEANLNTTSPLRYDRSRKEFTVVKRGLYYLYCQVHFNEGKTIYMKLDVMLDDQLALRCLEEFSPTSSGPQEPELKVCQVSGLVLLAPGESIRLRTIPKVRLKADRYLTYFGLFQVHPAWPPDPAPSSASPLGSLDAAEVLFLNVDGLESGGHDKTEAYLDIETALPGAAGRRQENTEGGEESGSRPGLDREPPSLLATLWVGACALGVGLLACLFTLASLQSRLEMLHEELSLLRGELKVEADARGKPEALQETTSRCVRPRRGWLPTVLSWPGCSAFNKQRLPLHSFSPCCMLQKAARSTFSVHQDPVKSTGTVSIKKKKTKGVGVTLHESAGDLACKGLKRRKVFSRKARPVPSRLPSQQQNISHLPREDVCHKEAAESPSEFVVPPLLHPRPPMFLERKRRDAAKTSHRQGRQRRKQSVLHLVPVRHHSNDEGDSTEIWWEPFLHQGGALVPSGQEVLVKHTGLYFIYSQVLFHDPMFTMGQVLMRMPVGKPDQILFRCVQSMPSDPEKAYNSCYSGGIFHLHQGDRLNLRIPRFNASFDASAHGTFLGLLRL
nr:uncharacterized protein LOC110087747 [Pogona vitticeps]